MITTNKQIATYYILSEAFNKQMAMDYLEERCKFESDDNLDVLQKSMPEYIAGWVVNKVEELANKMDLGTGVDVLLSPSELKDAFGSWYKLGRKEA